MERIFNPRSIVVVGVSERPDNLARNVLANLRAFHYQGDLYAVGRQSGMAHGVPIVDSLDLLPDDIDLAVILTPAALVPGLVDACGRKGIRRVVIETGGFGEFSPAGRLLEEQLVEAAQRWNIRFVGPNCISVVNLEAGVCLPFALLSPDILRLGSASVVAQSGGVSITYMDWLSVAGVGVNKAVSIGNKTDLDENAYLSCLLDDPGTEMVCLYLESIVDGRQMMEMARASRKPLIVHKANRGQAAQSIALSHTAALANDDRIVSAAFRQAGILRADGFRDVIATAQGLVLPSMRGNDLVIISRSGGHAVAAADAAERFGFRLMNLPETFTEQVRAFFRADVIAPTNPIDLGVIFDFDLYGQIVELCLRALSPDAVLLINTYSLHEAEAAARLARRVEQLQRESQRPVAFCAYAEGKDAMALYRQIDMPIFTEVEDALRGLAASRDRQRWLARSPAVVEASAAPPVAWPPLPAAGLLTTDQALALCQAYGLPVAGYEVAADPAAAVAAAGRLGYPVALKLLATEVVHKSDVGGVALGLADEASVRRAAETLLGRWSAARLLVQRMVDGGVEVILGGKRDPSFGPVVMLGLGGVFVEVFDDVAFRVAPLGRVDAEELIDEVRGSRLLAGVRGRPPADRQALVEAILALSQLLVEQPQIAEIDVNPLLVLEHGALAVDARVVTAP